MEGAHGVGAIPVGERHERHRGQCVGYACSIAQMVVDLLKPPEPVEGVARRRPAMEKGHDRRQFDGLPS